MKSNPISGQLSRALIGLGSNQGERPFWIRKALTGLATVDGCRLTAISALYQSDPVGNPNDHSPYLNAVCVIETDLSPHQILDQLLRIEQSLGRIRRERWGPRTIDLDLLFFENQILQEPGLNLPHPRATRRSFVLEPANDVCPDFQDPVSGSSLQELRNALAVEGEWTPLDRLEPTMPIELASRQDIREYIRSAHENGQTVGFVPTMGFLHQGHASLLQQARLENDLVLLSIYVNPLQFGPEEDFEQYPRDPEKDFALARETGVDAILTLSQEPMYSPEHATYVDVEGLTEGLCGSSRPGHFRGVTTIVAKLFGLVTPDRAYFGQKDAQQAAILRQMTTDLEMAIEIRILPIVREPDGLALSSRNVYLDREQRQEAAKLYQSLLRAHTLVENGERNTGVIEEAVRKMLDSCPGAQIDYIGLVDSRSLQPVERIERETLLALAVRWGRTRLIDNTLLSPSS